MSSWRQRTRGREYAQTLREGDLTGPSTSTRIWVDDVNTDSKLDILVGDLVTLVAPAEGLTPEQVKEKTAKWQEEFSQAVKEYEAAAKENDPKKVQEASQKYIEIYQQRSKFITEERTGFVWLYLQK